jgi:hypothetical protein
MGMRPPALQITIPKQDYCIDALIQRLRYLETQECRNKVSEEWRLLERAEVTKQFRKAIEMRDFFNDVKKQMCESKMDVEYDLYK